MLMSLADRESMSFGTVRGVSSTSDGKNFIVFWLVLVLWLHWVMCTLAYLLTLNKLISFIDQLVIGLI